MESVSLVWWMTHWPCCFGMLQIFFQKEEKLSRKAGRQDYDQKKSETHAISRPQNFSVVRGDRKFIGESETQAEFTPESRKRRVMTRPQTSDIWKVPFEDCDYYHYQWSSRMWIDKKHVSEYELQCFSMIREARNEHG